jgi:DNA-directed RNA polymerase subunit omega
MSIYPSPDKLDNKPEDRPSKYALVILAAKRARQVKDKAQRLIETRSTNPLTVALEEIAEGMLIPRVVEDATAAAFQAALKPAEPSLEDIIGAGPVLAIDTEQDALNAQRDALMAAEGDLEEDELLEVADDEEEIRPIDAAFSLDAPDLMADLEEEEIHEDSEDEEE